MQRKRGELVPTGELDGPVTAIRSCPDSETSN